LPIECNDPLPDVDGGTLGAYCEYLSQNLVFPFIAKHAAKYSPLTRVAVISLNDSDNEPMFDEMYGVCSRSEGSGKSIASPIDLLKNAEGQQRSRNIRSVLKASEPARLKT
jgi:hypothetical protein